VKKGIERIIELKLNSLELEIFQRGIKSVSEAIKAIIP
jgi:malate/lactate dehydrogenase